MIAGMSDPQRSPDRARLCALPTPSLVLDEGRMMRNIERLRSRLSALSTPLRPHMKTAKSMEVARRMFGDAEAAATVSTLHEAEIFAAAGVHDILYAVGVSPDKLERVQALRATGCDLSVVLDSIRQAEAVAQASRLSRDPIPALIEIDCDGHRSGLDPTDPSIVAIGAILHEAGCLRGVMTHAGGSYGMVGEDALADFADRERMAATTAAGVLIGAGLPCPVVSVGSTPTAHFARQFDGVTEVRAGVFVFFDLVMAGIGVCSMQDIALSVLTTVIGHQKQRGWIIVDAGWMALSRDLGTQAQAVDQGYGVVCDIDGRVMDDLIVTQANQEHGVIAVRPGGKAVLPDLPVGERLRILPNHACSTAAQFDAYQVLPADVQAPIVQWARFRGW